MTVYDPKTGERVSKPHRFTGMKLRRISGVDRPAQEPAKAVLLMKRADDAEPPSGEKRIRKFWSDGYSKPALTSIEDGHQHMLDLALRAGDTSWGNSEDGESGHSHPYVVDIDGTVTIGASEGHTHTVLAVAKSADAEPEEPMTETKQNAEDQAALTKRVADLEAKLADQTARANMNDAEKAHLATLQGDAAKSFIAAKPEDRAATVEAAKAADRVVYKAADGTEYRASDDRRLVEMAKRSDRLEADAEKARDEREAEVLKARAKDELGRMKGGEPEKVALLKAVGSIEDDAVRGKVLDMLKAHDAGLSKAFERAGTGGERPDDDAESKLDAMAKKYAVEKGVSVPRAYDEVTKTPEGKVLFEAALGETQPVN